MGGMKGFYFSLDAITASMVLIALIGMLTVFTPETQSAKEPYQLDYLETASIQDAGDWNNSLPENETVLEHIQRHQVLGNASRVEEVCDSYFDFSGGYALFFSDEDDRQKICGDLTVSPAQNLAVNRVLMPDTEINGTFKGPKTAVLVMKN